MQSEWMPILERWRDLTVLVIGDAMLDSYVRGNGNRLCQEAPVPVVDVVSETEAAGGAANTAANLAALTAKATLISAIGPDREGQALLHALHIAGVGTNHVIIDSKRQTLSKQRVLAGSQLVTRLDRGSTEPIGSRTEARLMRHLQQLYGQSDAVVISDYGYGIMTDGLIEALTKLQQRQPRVLVVDAKDPVRYQRVGATVVKPNYTQLRR
ncbi:MAG TPA: PfkB family carbohydrate kinase, partial [Candidatus Saccharimonadales bacterium]|nr:PfkB family carbohydrate kinase [Candidatus Saccharimonadales bacterium]